GTSMLTVVMGHMDESVEMLAAHAIMGNIDKFSTVICFGVAAASAVVIGKEIGEGASDEHVQSLAKTLLALALLAGILTGGLLLGLLPVFFEPVLFPLFDLSPLAAQIATYMCLIYALTMPMRAFDVTNITGVLRAGGDVRAAICIDIIPLWCVAVPLSALAGVVLRCDPVWVCLAMQAENLCKLPAGVLRLKSRKWIHNVTKTL
ncbi:MAG: MATE family efflux transporter, partial [Oscillospiraceae bacterium]|nr:MATE family efflux transporter [Oscillospiraceae bacterium]